MIMPKEKSYEYDYEWSGEENKPKGVNLHEKNPWNKPNWGNAAKPVASSGQTSQTPQSDPLDMDELQRRHQWETPNWATVKDGKKDSNKEILKDSIPKPMLKKTAAGTASGIQGASATGGKTDAISIAAAEAEIADMERRIQEARMKKAALEQEKQLHDEVERAKHTVEETKLEQARRLAKEREEARWRATLAERNALDKEKREKARLAATQQGANPSSDAAWSKTQEEQQQRHQERVQQEATRRQAAEREEAIEIERDSAIASERDSDVNPVQSHRQLERSRFEAAGAGHGDGADCEEEEYDEEYEDEVEEDYEVDEIDDPFAATADELQRQIDELRRQLGSA